MIPSKILGKVAGVNWIGLVDGTYGIILTLLLIELPAIVLQLLNEKERFVGMQAVAQSLLIVIISCFSVFTIIYNIWSYHKTLLLEAIKLRLFAIATGWLLFTASLIPPFYFLVNHYAVKEILESTSARSDCLTYFRFIVFYLIFIIYVLLAVLAKTEKRQLGQSSEKRKELEILFGTALSKGLIAAAFGYLLVKESSPLPPPSGVLIMALVTYFPVNFFDSRIRLGLFKNPRK